MKIVKIFGVVIGIHAFFFLLIFANPGCTTRTPDRPSPAETAAPAIVAAPAAAEPMPSPISAAPITFSSDAAATGIHYSPTRPGTPAAGALQAQPVADVVSATTYTVKSGDNLWLVAKRNHLTAGELAAANNLKANAVVKPGQKLVIPAKPVSATDRNAAAPPAVAPPPPKAPADAMHHTVAPGESLSVIAAKYGVRSGDLAVVNNISDPRKLRAGMELVIPGWKGTDSRAGKSTTAKSPAAGAGVPTTVRLPAADQDLDTGLKPASTTPIPVISTSDGPVIIAPKKP